MLSDAQLFSLELGHSCNLCRLHSDCPIRSRRFDNDLPLTIEERVELAVAAYTQFNFHGLVAFQYYNEPMLRKEDMFAIMTAVKARVPEAGFLLWTNGTVTPDDPRMSLFTSVFCTDYFGQRNQLEAYYKKYIPHVNVIGTSFDARLQNWRTNPIELSPCDRPRIECVIDDWGNARMCCQDWRGDIPMGNVRREGLAAILKTRKALVAKICAPMDNDTPERCRHCAGKATNIRVLP